MLMMKFFVGFFFAILFTPSTQKENWKILEKQCKHSVEKVDQCWIKHSELPECETSDRKVVVCGQDASQKLLFCNKEVQMMSKKTVRNYEIIHEAICDDDHLREAFEKNPACWFTARNCAIKLLNKTITAVDLDSLDCKDAIDEAAECSSFDPWCSELHENLTLAAYGKSECGNTYPEGEKLVSSAYKLDTFYLVLFTSVMVSKSYEILSTC